MKYNTTDINISEAIFVFISSFCCFMACAVLVNAIGLSSVTASALVALIASTCGGYFKFPGNYSLAAYAGSFGGMGKISWDDDRNFMLLALSVLVSCIVLFFHSIKPKHPMLAFSGLGGRLGFFGFIGFTLFSILIMKKIPTYHVYDLNLEAYMCTMLM